MAVQSLKPVVAPKAVRPAVAPKDLTRPDPLMEDIKAVVVPGVAAVVRETGKAVAQGSFWKELGLSTLKGNLKGNLLWNGVGSTVRNVVALAKHQQTPARAVGNVAADLAIGTANGVVTGLAVTGATMAITAVGLTAAPVLLGAPAIIGTMAVSWGVNRGLNKLDEKFGFRKTISDNVAKVFGEK
ncbi:MAG: hypothetical protein VKO64_03315 [Candidatus Sericytochromatia bacterium]|nr:hypothetical protein [Candidatus Sericytochromatia bacterium]